MRKLPFLNGIKAFEAAARNGGFAKAAEELHVSPAAISRMVHLLEQRLGVLLFERKANGLTLTAAGRVYQSGLTQLFDALANLTAQVTAVAGRTLTIGVGPTFAARWFIPRLASFQKQHPDLRSASPPAAPLSLSMTSGHAVSGSATARGPASSPILYSPPISPRCARQPPRGG